jgi:hypothetical protein
MPNSLEISVIPLIIVMVALPLWIANREVAGPVVLVKRLRAGS